MSRHPVETIYETTYEVEISECIIASHQVSDNFQTVTFDRVKEENLKDKQMMKLVHYIQTGFPETEDHLPLELHEFLIIRYSLFMMDGVIICGDRKKTGS